MAEYASVVAGQCHHLLLALVYPSYLSFGFPFAGVSLSKLLEEDALLLPGPQRIRVPESAAADLVKACPVQVDSKVALKRLGRRRGPKDGRAWPCLGGAWAHQSSHENQTASSDRGSRARVGCRYLAVLVLHSLGWLDQHNGAARHVQAALWEDCPSQPGDQSVRSSRVLSQTGEMFWTMEALRIGISHRP